MKRRSYGFGSLALLALAGQLGAQPPDLPGWHSVISLDASACFERAVQALRAAGLQNIGTQERFAAVGTTPNLRAGITCVPVGGRTVASADVAGNFGHGGESTRMLEFLRDCMAGVNNCGGAVTMPPVSSTPGPPVGAGNVDISGTWVETADGGSSELFFQPLGGNRYSMTENGKGNATGTAVVTGRHIRIDWSTPDRVWAGVTNIDLDATGARGSQTFTFTRGPQTGRVVTGTVARKGPAPAGPAPSSSNVDISGAWVETAEGGSSELFFQPLGGNRYSMRENGKGNSTGTAVVNGRRIRVDWTTPDGVWAGYTYIDLDATGARGSHTFTFTRGPRTGQTGTGTIARK